jgi:hypothetical protein
MGIAKLIFEASAMMAVLIPMTSPQRLSSGPPELPVHRGIGLNERLLKRNGVSGRIDSSPINPRVHSDPALGLPMAKTSSPMRTRSDRPTAVGAPR